MRLARPAHFRGLRQGERGRGRVQGWNRVGAVQGRRSGLGVSGARGLGAGPGRGPEGRGAGSGAVGARNRDLSLLLEPGGPSPSKQGGQASDL